MSIKQCESLKAALTPQESLLPLKAPSSNTVMKPWQASSIKQSTQQRGKGRTKREDPSQSQKSKNPKWVGHKAAKEQIMIQSPQLFLSISEL
jgi:hypothetical protein